MMLPAGKVILTTSVEKVEIVGRGSTITNSVVAIIIKPDGSNDLEVYEKGTERFLFRITYSDLLKMLGVT